MNNILRKVGALTLALTMLVGGALSTSSFATTESTVTQTPNILSVSGEGIIEVKPDMAYLNIGYESKSKDAAVAQAETATKMTEIMKAIKAQGINEEDIKTTSYSLYKTYDYIPDQPREEFYVASNNVKITINNVDQVGAIIDAVTKAGSNKIDQIQFAVKDEKKYYNDALILAVKDAASKADAILGIYDLKAGIPSKINEQSYSRGIAFKSMDAMAVSEAASTPIETGTLEIKANISAEFSY